MSNFMWFSTVSEFMESSKNEDFIHLLASEYNKRFHENPGLFLYNSWKSEIKYLRENLNSFPELFLALEYEIPGGGERADAILIGSSNGNNAGIVELKGWKAIKIIDDYTAYGDNEVQVNPVYQVMNYAGKIKYSTNIPDEFKISFRVVLYNINNDGSMDSKIIIFRHEKEKMYEYLKTNMGNPVSRDDALKFINAVYRQNNALFNAIRSHYDEIRNGTMNMLAESGFGLDGEQIKIFDEIIESIKNNEKRTFLINGKPGSGKTLMAIELLLKSLSMKKNSVLAYRNNRMIASLRSLFDSIDRGMSTAIKFYSTGRPGNPGIAEKGGIKGLDVAIFDEAQRMKPDNIKIACDSAKITVFFYDPEQILSLNEGGTDENFKNFTGEHSIYSLYGNYRNGNYYNNFINKLLDNSISKEDLYIENYDLQYMDSPDVMINSLRNKQPEHKTALVASFTESPGDSANKSSIKNLRAGYPLYSNFDLYKNSNAKIYWLMDPKKDYAPFWVNGKSNTLDTCASIYGCQGFESGYIGLIWGRDLVYRDGQWELGDNCEDSLGGFHSLKKLFYKGKDGDKKAYDEAINLLKNRYRILLTRGISGTFVFCEDTETAEYLKSIISKLAIINNKVN